MGKHAFELLTPRGFGGVAVVAVVGDDRVAAATARVGRAAIDAAATGRPRLASLRCGGEVLDQALVVVRSASIEFHLHGSEAVLSALETEVGGFAEPALRRGDALLRDARSSAQLALALEQRPLDFATGLAAARAAGAVALRALWERSVVAMALSAPQRVVLCGDQNAGKSTLMNRLLFRERVLTGDLPGLTRDAVAETVELDGYPYLLVDTAGEGEVAPGLDESALARAREERRRGLRLLVIDGHRVPSFSDREIRDENTLVVRSKADLPPAPWPSDFDSEVTVSGLHPVDAAGIRTQIGGALRRHRGLPPAGPAGGLAAIDAGEMAALRAAWEPPEDIGRNL